MDYPVIVAYALGLLLLYLLVRALVVPIRLVSHLVYSAAVGGVLLWVIHFVGAWVNFHVALNPVTALTVGVLGVPGLALVIALQSLIT